MDLKALRAAMQAAHEKFVGLVNTIGNATPTAEQEAELNAAEAAFETAQAAYDRAVKAEKMGAALGTSPGRRSPSESPAIPIITGGAPAIESDPKRGFTRMAEFGYAVARASIRGDRDQRLTLGTPGISSATSVESIGADGGFMVPPDFANEVLKNMFDESGVFAACTQRVTAGNSVTQPKSQATPWGATGVQANWTGEDTAITTSKAALGNVTTQLHKLAVLCPASDELLEDAPLLQSFLTEDAAAAIAWKVDDAIVNGDGVVKPLGFASASNAALIVQAKETGQVADSIVIENLAKMVGRLTPGSFSRSVWIAGPEAYAALLTMKFGDGPALLESNRPLVNLPSVTLLGRPIIVSQTAKALGDQGDIYLCDLARGYQLLTKANGVTFAESIHLYFDTGKSAFRWTFRVGGRPWLSAAVSAPNTSFTMGHFVTLAARA